MAVKMRARDVISAPLAECYLKVDGEVYNFMQALAVEARFEKNKMEVAILGQPGKGNKASGWKGTGTAKFYYNTSLFRELMYRYKKSGEDLYFDMTIVNEDPASAVGRQIVILKDCNLDSGVLAKFDADGEVLEEKMDFTFEDFEIKEKFSDLNGMNSL